MRLLTTAALVVALSLGACGNDDNDEQSAGTTAAPTTTEPAKPPPPAEDAVTANTLPELVAETQATLTDVVDAAQRLAQDPSADVTEELRDIRERANALAERARAIAPDAQDAAGAAGAEAEQLREQAEQELSEPERRELRDSLVAVNERAAEAADRLERVVDPEDAAAVARAELREAEDQLDAAARQLEDVIPDDVRDRVDQLEEQLRGVTG